MFGSYFSVWGLVRVRLYSFCLWQAQVPNSVCLLGSIMARERGGGWLIVGKHKETCMQIILGRKVFVCRRFFKELCCSIALVVAPYHQPWFDFLPCTLLSKWRMSDTIIDDAGIGRQTGNFIDSLFLYCSWPVVQHGSVSLSLNVIKVVPMSVYVCVCVWTSVYFLCVGCSCTHQL